VFIDTSAFVAILAREPDDARLGRAIERAEHRRTSGLVRPETVMRVSTLLDTTPEAAQEAFDRLLEGGGIAVAPITDAIVREAVTAFARYSKGRGHPARLNLADCLSYAVAKSYREPILFVGDDFAKTDLEPAL
jgi:ribonuclease VapC